MKQDSSLAKVTPSAGDDRLHAHNRVTRRDADAPAGGSDAIVPLERTPHTKTSEKPQHIPHLVAAPHTRSPLNIRTSSAALLAIDFAVIMLARVVTGASYHLAAYGIFGDLAFYLVTGALAGAGFCALVRLQERRQPFKRSSANERARNAALFWLLAFLSLIAILFVLKATEHVSRGAMLLFFAFGGIAAITSRVKAPALFLTTSNDSTANRSLILVGAQDDSAVEELAAGLGTELWAQPAVVTFDANCAEDEWPWERERICAHVMDVARTSADGVIGVSSRGIPHDRLQAVLNGLSLVPRTILVIPDAQTSYYLRHPLMPFETALSVEIQKAPLNRAQRTIKRAIDLSLASTLLLLSLPVLVLIAAAIKLEGPGPVLFRQTRNGLGGKPFKILKFRTMQVMEDGDRIVQAKPGDQRLTRIGKTLRKTSLDELPQLFNVLMGHMSLVGPRPHAQAHDEFYATLVENYELRQHFKPGITGWAQVNGFRGPTPTVFLMRRRIEHDLWYVTHASILLDLKILARTVLEVMKQRNAY